MDITFVSIAKYINLQHPFPNNPCKFANVKPTATVVENK